ncbi:MAG: hypothetical protein JNM40_22125 [Myxococcales bacterium]|nr:hypothetical protein [Myxococcales bacterium]
MKIGDTLHFGRHRMVRVGHDRTDLYVEGDVVNADVDVIHQCGLTMRAECGYDLMLVDVSKMGNLSPETRRYTGVVSAGERNYHGAIAITGASLLTRALLTLFFRALELIRRTPNVTNPISFFASRDEALAWLDAQRARIQSSL